MAEPVVVDASSSSFLDRVSNWVSENKAVAYTIAGTVVIFSSAGVIYYLSEAQKSKAPPSPRKSKKERRKEKKEAEEAQKKASITLKDEEAGRSRHPTRAQCTDASLAPNFPRSTKPLLTASHKR
jgi:mitochondrial import receptor subunit TOM70